MTRTGLAGVESGKRIAESACEFFSDVSRETIVKVPEVAPADSLLTDDVLEGCGRSGKSPAGAEADLTTGAVDRTSTSGIAWIAGVN